MIIIYYRMMHSKITDWNTELITQCPLQIDAICALYLQIALTVLPPKTTGVLIA